MSHISEYQQRETEQASFLGKLCQHLQLPEPLLYCGSLIQAPSDRQDQCRQERNTLLRNQQGDLRDARRERGLRERQTKTEESLVALCFLRGVRPWPEEQKGALSRGGLWHNTGRRVALPQRLSLSLSSLSLPLCSEKSSK